MLFNEKKLRIYGPIVFGTVLLLFFMLPMFAAYHQYSFILLRIIGATVLWVVTVWEPTRLVILWAHKKWAGQTSRRILWMTLTIAPLTILIGFLRNQLENYLIWKLPLSDIAFYLSSIGTNFIFVMAQVALYEVVFYVEKWHKAEVETKELKKINLQMQFDSLKVQIQPHFLFNTLNTLIGLMKMDVPRAINFTEEMARVYRYLLEANDRQLISLEEELKFTKAYFFLIKTRYAEGLHLELNEENIPENLVLPPLSLQVLFENAVKHNVITAARPLKIKVHIDTIQNEISVSNNLQLKKDVHRNGMGLTQLEKKFSLLGTPGVRIEERDGNFTVIMPLIHAGTDKLNP